MRTLLIIVSIFLFTYWNARSQDTLNYTKLGIKINNETYFNKQGPYQYIFDATNVGLQVVQQINKSNFSIETGFYYMQRFCEADFPVYQGSMHLGYSWVNEPFNIFCNYYSVPVYLRYDIKFIYLEAGPNIDLLSSKTFQYPSPGNSLSDSGIGPYLSFNVNIGIDFNISRNFILFLEWRLNLQSSISDPNLFPNNFSNYGFGFGLEYVINPRKNTY